MRSIAAKFIANSLLTIAALVALGGGMVLRTAPLAAAFLAMLSGFFFGVFVTLAAFKASFAVTPERWRRLIDQYADRI